MDQEQREFNDFIGPGWYAWVITFSLSMLYYMNLTEHSWGTAAIFSILWGAVAWASMSFVMWVVAEYVPPKEEKKIIYTGHMDFAHGRPEIFTPEALRKNLLQNESGTHVASNSISQRELEKQFGKHVDKYLTSVGLKLDNRIITMNDTEREAVLSYMFECWKIGTDTLDASALPAHIIRALADGEYAKRDGSGNYMLTSKGKIIFPHWFDKTPNAVIS